MERFAKAVWDGLGALDTIIDKILIRSTRLWVAVTGRSNFALANLTLAIGKYVIPAGAVTNYVTDRGAFELIVAIISPIWMWMANQRKDLFERLEEWAENPTNTLPMSRFEFEQFAFTRLTNALCMVLILPGAIFLNPLSIGLIFYMISHHYVMHFEHKGGKTVWRKAFEKAKATGSKIKEKAKELIPEPAPNPIPALVGS